MDESLEKMSSAGLSQSYILTAVLDKELERNLSTLVFLALRPLLSAFEFSEGGEVSVARDEASERGLLCDSQGRMRWFSVFSVPL